LMFSGDEELVSALNTEVATARAEGVEGHTGLYQDGEGVEFVNATSDCVLRRCLTESSEHEVAHGVGTLRRAMENGNIELADEIVSGKKIALHLATCLGSLEILHGCRLPTEVWQLIAQMCIQTPQPARLTTRTPGKLFVEEGPAPPSLELEDCTFYLPETPKTPGCNDVRMVSVSNRSLATTMSVEREDEDFERFPEDFPEPESPRCEEILWLPDIG